MRSTPLIFLLTTPITDQQLLFLCLHKSYTQTALSLTLLVEVITFTHFMEINLLINFINIFA